MIAMKKSMLLLYILFFLITLSACSKQAGPIQGEVTFIAGTLKINGIDASVGNRVSKDDILITDEKSEAVIQITDAAVVTLKSGTEMKFGNLMSNNDESTTVSMELNRGNTYHKVLRKGTDYSVKAHTAVASVRGTSFEMSADRSKTRISVETGTVYVRKLPVVPEEKEIILRAGESIEIGSAGSGGSYYSGKKSVSSATGYGSEKQTVMDSKILTPEKVKNTPSVKNRNSSFNKKDTALTGDKIITFKTADAKKEPLSVNKKGSASVDSAAINRNTGTKKEPVTVSRKDSASTGGVAAVNRNTETRDETVSGKKAERTSAIVKKEKTPDPKEVRALADKKDRKIEDIKEVYNRIDKVYLYSGEVVSGAIIERGETYSILTTGGIVKVSRKDIQSNEIIR